ncbi:MAG: primase-helicase family protein [Pseudomonadota bacterium]
MTMLDAYRKTPGGGSTAAILQGQRPQPVPQVEDALAPLDALDALLRREEAPSGAAPTTTFPAQTNSAPSSTASPAANEQGVFADEAAAVAAINAEYLVTRINGEAVIMREGVDPDTGAPAIEPVSQPAFRLALANKHIYEPTPGGSIRRINVAKVWLESPKRREFPGGLTLCPPGTPLPKGAYNLWRGWGVDPIPGDAEPMLEHVHTLCGGDTGLTTYSLNFLARCVQRPGDRAGVSLVYRGGQGTGKGSLFNAMLHCFGAHGLHLTHRDQLVGRFNGHMRRALFVFADEAVWAGDKDAEGKLRGLVTEATVLLEQKGLDPVQVPNRIKLVIATNNEWAVPAGADERRFCVIDVSAEKAGDLEYFDRLHRWLREGGHGVWLHHLMHRDLSGFDVRRFPKTAALNDQKIATMPPLDRWILNALHTGTSLSSVGAWQDDEQLPCGVAGEAFKAYCDRASMRASRVDGRAIGQRLHAVFHCGAAVGGGKQGRHWRLPPLTRARELAAQRFGLHDFDWGHE